MSKKNKKKSKSTTLIKLLYLFFTIIGVLFLLLLTIEFLRDKAQNEPISIQYNLNDSSLEIKENNISSYNTVEDLDYKITTKTKILSLISSILKYMITFLIGFILVLIIYSGFKKK